ncbi:3-hydroxyacyl-ACP dehydratase FabZ family protein [Trichloromonas sp.]|uniref:3-hydroxyacyl-ACP dehydratase FabZ family protein n=1 Tax=Trichloromonas sp. TaxID=3069249 RepID=UPI003D81B5A6
MKSKLKRAVEARSVGTQQADDGGDAVGSFRFAADFPGFAGHFPAYPVLPAVVQVLTAQVVVEQLLGRPLIMRRLERAKFLKQVRPGQTLQVVCRERQSGGRRVWDARLTADGEPAATFWMTLAEENEG